MINQDDNKKQISSDLPETVNNICSNLNPIQHLENLDYPRLTGSDGEMKASKYIFDTLKSNGHEPEIQEFYFKKAKSLMNLLAPAALICWGLLSILNVIIFDNFILISIIILLLPVGIIFVILKFDVLMKFIFKNTRKKMSVIKEMIENDRINKEELTKSRNIIVNIGSKNSKNHLMFTAHYDSISLKLSMKTIKIFSMIGGGGLILYCLIYLINFITDLIFHINFIISWYFLILIILIISLVAFSTIFLARMFKTNESHGIIDDGTGVAILLELSKFLQVQVLQDYQITFCFFSGEELGLYGSGYYFSQKEHDKNKLQVISIDMIGEKSPITYIKGINPMKKILMEPNFNNNIKKIADILHIKIKDGFFLYPGSDFAHWLLNEYKTNWLINGSDFIHSKNDNIQNLNQKLVIDSLKLLVGYLIEFILNKS
ncbi:MAG: M28 family peptidase [Candidatus Lokiarchaeota archaeon]|nr:M28 family peptidase [Candidatus Lokiarchaeota archaeon]